LKQEIANTNCKKFHKDIPIKKKKRTAPFYSWPRSTSIRGMGLEQPPSSQ